MASSYTAACNDGAKYLSVFPSCPVLAMTIEVI